MDFEISQNFDDGELCVPSDFLSEEPPLKEKFIHRRNEPKIPKVFPYEWCSLGIPLDTSYNTLVELVVGSNKTKSDE